jgi:hypothetical protein
VSTPLKLAGFLAILALAFGVAMVAGGAVGPDREAADKQPADSGGETAGNRDAGAADAHDDHAAGSDDDAAAGGAPTVPDGGRAAGHDNDGADPVRGLSVSDRGLTLALARTELPRGRTTRLRFAIREAGGRAVRDFEVAHDKLMHLIVVRRDGRGFQHLHPRLGRRGTWRTRLTLPQSGAYRVFADFTRDGRTLTLATDVTVDGAANYRALPARADVVRTDGYRVRLDAEGSTLRFAISRGGRAVRTQRYLGARGHLVALREGDLAYLHVHPAAEGVAFEADLERGSRYRLYLQFKHRGRIHTAEFTR